MQIITTMAKPTFISGEILKPFCCGGFLGVICWVWFGRCLFFVFLGLVWFFWGGGGGLLFFFLCTSNELPKRQFRAEYHAPYSKSSALEFQMQLFHSDPWKWEELDRKISVKTNSEVGDIYRQTVICQTCGCEAISHIAFQDPGASAPCFMQLQLKAFCAVWTAQFSANKLVCLLYRYLPMF